MTNVVAVTGTPQMATAATMTAKDKGSFGNRVDCAWAHTVNNVKYTAKGAATLAAGGAAAYGIHKLPASALTQLNKLSNSGLNNAANAVKGGKLGDAFSKVLTKLANTSGKTKALALIGTLTAATMLYLTRAQAFKAGQIDQKYTDRAKAQEVAK